MRKPLMAAIGLLVSVLRIPYVYLNPVIVVFCILGVYEVSHSIVDVWIMLIMSVVGYLLRTFDFDPAPLVLGLVNAPTLELSLRQSLDMSSGDCTFFFRSPISETLLAIAIGLLLVSAASLTARRANQRAKLVPQEGVPVWDCLIVPRSCTLCHLFARK